MSPTEIVKTVCTVATAGFFARRRVHQCRLDALGLGLMVLTTSLGRCGSLLRVVTIEVFECADLIIPNTLVMILVVIFVQLMCVVSMIRGDTGGEACGRRSVVVLIVIAVLVVAFIRFREIGGRGSGRCARTRGVLWQASNGSVSPSVSYVRFLHLLYWLVFRGRIRVLAIRVFGRHIQHEIDGFVVESRRLRVLC